MSDTTLKRRVTSHDVAKAAGVSQSSVSLVMSGRTNARIPEATRERIFAAARALNYRPSSVARTLATGRTQRIGLVANTPWIFLGDQQYYQDILRGLMKGVISANYNLLLHSAQFQNDNALGADILSGGTDGVLLIGREPDDPLTAALLDADFPVVSISYVPNRPKFYAIDCDNVTGGYLMVKHLLELGHRQIGMLNESRVFSWVQERQRGIDRALEEAGLTADDLILLSDKIYSDPLRLAQEIVRRRALPTPLTAFIFHDEWLPRAVAELLPGCGARVPEDFSIVSFNSTEASERTRPPLTSVYQPVTEIGAAALGLLVDLIEGRAPKPGVLRFPVRLDVRNSTSSVSQVS